MTLNGIVSHQDWLPTFAAAAGAPDVKEKLLTGVELNGRTYKNHIDGYNMLDYLSGKTEKSPRPAFIYVNDDADIVAIRWNDWKVVYKENRGQAFGVWREPFTDLRVPLAVQPAPGSLRAGAAQRQYLRRLGPRPSFHHIRRNGDRDAVSARP